jgi:two-component system sensor histidine kinase QseC
LAVSGGLKPLKRLAHHVSRRAPDDFHSVDLHQVPREVLTLVEALNQLFERYHQMIERERRFTGDASHELRTPLAGLRVQAQLACRCEEEGTRRRALGQLLVGIDRATHIVEQLLDLARLDPPQVATDMELLALGSVMEEARALLRDDADRKSINVEVEADPAEVTGDSSMLLILIRNLLDNAIRYAPSGGHVRLSCGTDGRRSWLQLDDSGPGIPEAERQRVFKRFYRAESQGEAGCGLGLSIAQRIVELHGAQLGLGDSPLGGLQVRVVFPFRSGDSR